MNALCTSFLTFRKNLFQIKYLKNLAWCIVYLHNVGGYDWFKIPQKVGDDTAIVMEIDVSVAEVIVNTISEGRVNESLKVKGAQLKKSSPMISTNHYRL